MTDEQIMSGFKLFLRKQMSKLSFAEKLACADIIVLINRQRAEIERLKVELKAMRGRQTHIS